MAPDQTRRTFLRTAPLAAAITLPLTATLLPAGEPQSGTVHTGTASTPVPFQLFTADKLAEAMKRLQSAPGNDNLSEPRSLPFTIVLTTEQKKSAKEFEYHEGRDHILQVLEGSTLYQLGGTPRTPRNTRPGEWLAPDSEGATSITLNKGDMLVIPRNTPHKRSTATSVTFFLISTTGSETS